MALPDGVHALALDYEFEGREMTINPAAVETEKGTVLVDAALPGSADRIDDRLRAAGTSLDDVTAVVVTHHDGDHVGSLAAVVEGTDATVYAHPDEAPHVDGRKDPAKGDPEDRAPPVPVDVQTPGGVRFRTLAGPMDVVETPGHAPGHVSLHFPDHDLLIAADALNVVDGELSGYEPEFTPDEARATESIGRLADLDVTTTLCYHGGVVEHDAGRIAAIHDELS